MITDRRYSIADLEPYIDWLYFFHAWEMPRKGSDSDALKQEALDLLHTMESEGDISVRARVGLFDANAEGDDIVLRTHHSDKRMGGAEEVRLPCLRQQHIAEQNSYNLCLADFIKPADMNEPDRIGVFATTADFAADGHSTSDVYHKMLAQTLCDRLAEAAACRLHEEVRKVIWAYAPDELLSPDELLREKNQGIRPAVGYPSLPDQSINFLIEELIGMSEIGISLTENGAMSPHASVSGLMLAPPKAQYFAVGKIDRRQLEDYAARRGLPIKRMEQFLAASTV